MVSRATAYRYFPTIEALLVEAPLDGELAEPEALFASIASVDPSERLDRAEASLHQMMYRNEARLRIMLAHTLQAGAAGEPKAAPVRQNRRGAIIEAALAPARSRLDDRVYRNLAATLALVFGTESMIVFRDVLPLTPERAREVKSWAIHTLVAAALAESAKESVGPKSSRRSRPRPRR
jgi:hypothetical protein